MLFYRINAKISGSKWFDEEKETVFRRCRRELGQKIGTYSRSIAEKGIVFLSDAGGDYIDAGMILKKKEGVDEFLGGLTALIETASGGQMEDTEPREIMLSELEEMLRNAVRSGYLEDGDDVYRQIGIADLMLRHTGLHYTEDMFPEETERSLRKRIRQFPFCDDLSAEMDRIFSSDPVNTHVTGHPVHYMIQTDDKDTSDLMYKTVIGSLYSRYRIENRRYSVLNLNMSSDVSMRPYRALYRSSAGGAVIVNFRGTVDEDDLADGGRELIEFICSVAKEFRHKVLTVFCLPKECSRLKELFFENLDTMSFVELKDNLVSGDKAKAYLKTIAGENSVATDRKLYKRIKADEGYYAHELRQLFNEWFDEKLRKTIYPQYSEIVSVKKKIEKAEPKGSAYEELEQMIGLSEAKKVINQALAYAKAQKLFADKGMRSERLSMHMVFTGNPGTAKTTVARLFARIMRENEVLSIGHMVEVGRGDLVGKYVGWTAPTIQKKFREAQGGVLFIDEAYSLVDDRSGSYGDEAINTIVQEMENHRKDTVVIFAGYPDKMKGFLDKNPGLRSRISFYVPFEDYSTEELGRIARLMAEKDKLQLAEDAVKKLEQIFDEARGNIDFGNGRFVRNVLEKARMQQAVRLLEMGLENVSRTDVSLLTAADIEIPAAEPSKTGIKIGFAM